MWGFTVIEFRNENGRRHVHFTESVAFSVKLAWQPTCNDNDMPKFIPDSGSCLLGLSKKVSFVSGFHLDVSRQNIKLTICLYHSVERTLNKIAKIFNKT